MTRRLEQIPFWRRLRRRFYWFLSWALLHLAGIVPLGWGRACGVALGRLAYRLRPLERQRAERNLARALPEVPVAARSVLLRESADSMGRNFFNTLAAPRLIDIPGAVREEGVATAADSIIGKLLNDLAARRRGVFVLTGHLGCWELAGAWVARLLSDRALGPLGVVTGTVRNPAVDRMLQERRRQLGLRPLPRDEGAGPLIRFLRGGGIVAILPDQWTGTRNIEVPFFGHPAPTPVGLAALALRYGSPILPVAGVWQSNEGRLVMRHLPPILPEDFAADDYPGVLTCCNKALEAMIRRNPEQWVWFHRRWNDDG